MRKTYATIALLVPLLPAIGNAHEVNTDFFDPKPIVDDLNVISATLDKDSLTKTDVVIVASAACATMRVAQRDLLPANSAIFLNENYPTSDQVSRIELADFIEFERQRYSELGASEQTLTLVTNQIGENPSIPPTSPAADRSINDEISAIEVISCEARKISAKDPSAIAEEEEQSLARALAVATVGVGAIVVDASITVETGGIGAVIGIVSGGWGWNRVEDSFPAIDKLWKSIFK